MPALPQILYYFSEKRLGFPPQDSPDRRPFCFPRGLGAVESMVRLVLVGEPLRGGFFVRRFIVSGTFLAVVITAAMAADKPRDTPRAASSRRVDFDKIVPPPHVRATGQTLVGMPRLTVRNRTEQ